jgi:hypothetical protein
MRRAMAVAGFLAFISAEQARADDSKPAKDGGIRGGVDLRFGPDAYGGVVNFVTAPIPSKPTARFRGAYGSGSECSAPCGRRASG